MSTKMNHRYALMNLLILGQDDVIQLFPMFRVIEIMSQAFWCCCRCRRIDKVNREELRKLH